MPILFHFVFFPPANTRTQLFDYHVVLNQNFFFVLFFVHLFIYWWQAGKRFFQVAILVAGR